MDKRFFQYIHQFLKVSEKYVVSQIPKCGCSTVTLQSALYNFPEKNYSMDLFSDAEDKHLNTTDIGKKYFNTDSLFSLTRPFHINESNVKYYKNQKVVVIFRDPLERFISACNTFKILGHLKDPFEKCLFIKNKLQRGLTINNHFNPQHIYYDFDDVDIFVSLENYPKFCYDENIPWMKANKNNSKKYLEYVPTQELINEIKDLYKEDYELIEKIYKSNKLYKPLE